MARPLLSPHAISILHYAQYQMIYSLTTALLHIIFMQIPDRTVSSPNLQSIWYLNSSLLWNIFLHPQQTSFSSDI